MWSGWAGKSPHNLPRVQLRVVFLNALQISPFWVGVAPCYINTTIYHHSSRLHPPLLHHWYWSPFISVYVVAVCYCRLSTHQIQLVVERHGTKPVLWKKRISNQNTVSYYIIFYSYLFFFLSYLDGDLLWWYSTHWHLACRLGFCHRCSFLCSHSDLRSHRFSLLLHRQWHFLHLQRKQGFRYHLINHSRL